MVYFNQHLSAVCPLDAGRKYAFSTLFAQQTTCRENLIPNTKTMNNSVPITKDKRFAQSRCTSSVAPGQHR